MKKTFFIWIVLLACLMAATGTMAQKKRVLYVDDIHFRPDGKADLPIYMDYETTDSVVGWNFYLILPEGVDLSTDEIGHGRDFVYNISSELHSEALRNGFGIRKVKGKERTYLLYCIDMEGLTPMTRTHGRLLTLELETNGNAEVSKGLIKDIALASTDELSLEKGQISDVSLDNLSNEIKDIQYSGDSSRKYNLGGLRVVTSLKGIIILNRKKVIDR